jgi:hypothetical protein
MKNFLCFFFLFFITLATAQTNLNWTSIAPVCMNATIGKPDKLNFYTVAGVQPKTSALAAMQSVNFSAAAKMK